MGNCLKNADENIDGAVVQEIGKRIEKKYANHLQMKVVRDDDVPETFIGASQMEQRGALKDPVSIYERLL